MADRHDGASSEDGDVDFSDVDFSDVDFSDAETVSNASSDSGDYDLGEAPAQQAQGQQAQAFDFAQMVVPQTPADIAAAAALEASMPSGPPVGTRQDATEIIPGPDGVRRHLPGRENRAVISQGAGIQEPSGNQGHLRGSRSHSRGRS